MASGWLARRWLQVCLLLLMKLPGCVPSNVRSKALTAQNLRERDVSTASIG